MKELNQTKHKVIIIDDEPEDLDPLVEYLEEKGCSVRVKKYPEEGLTETKNWQPDLVLLDIYFKTANTDGSHFFSDIQNSMQKPNVVYFSDNMTKDEYLERPLLPVGSDAVRDPIISKWIGYKKIYEELVRAGRL